MTAPEATALKDQDPMLDASSLLESAHLYAGDDLENVLVSPINGDFDGLCPSLVFASTTEILIADTRTFAARASAAGAAVTVCEFEGLIHVWPFVDGLPETTAVMEEVATFVEGHFAR
jgi:acetyl esterase/lipase